MADLFKQISKRLKNLRHERGWSLDKTAQATGVSKAMLGQIEREESSPTIATLWKIASGFNTSFSSFLEEEGSDTYPFYRLKKAQILHPNDDKIRVMPLFPFDKTLHFEVFVIELLPGCEHLSPPHETGVIEHVIVSTGSMEVFVNGSWQLLSKGSGIRFEANQAHGYRNLSSEIACIHDLIHYPSIEAV